MRLSALILMSVSLAANAQTLKVDHVTIAGRNLSQLQNMFRAVHLPTEFGGKHTNGLTEMALASFADGSYLELIAAQSPAGAHGHYWSKFIDGNAGPCAWAINVGDMQVEADRLKAAGISIQPVKSGRKRPDGVSLSWETASVGPGPQGTFFPFLIHDDTPREERAFPKGRPTLPEIEGVAAVVVGVRDLDDAIRKYRSTFGLSKPVTQTDAGLGLHIAWFRDTPVVLAAPLAPDTWLAKRLDQFGEAPCAILLQVKDRSSFPTVEQSVWFQRSVSWFDPKKLSGMRIGIRTE